MSQTLKVPKLKIQENRRTLITLSLKKQKQKKVQTVPFPSLTLDDRRTVVIFFILKITYTISFITNWY